MPKDKSKNPMYIEKQLDVTTTTNDKPSYIMNKTITITNKRKKVVTSCNNVRLFTMELDNNSTDKLNKKKKRKISNDTLETHTKKILTTLKELPDYGVNFSFILKQKGKDPVFEKSEKLKFVIDEFKKEFESSLNEFY